MLTGDVRSMARPIASSLSFDMVKCELSNESKLEALNYLRESKGNSAETKAAQQPDQQPDENGFMQVPDGMDDLPF